MEKSLSFTTNQLKIIENTCLYRIIEEDHFFVTILNISSRVLKVNTNIKIDIVDALILIIIVNRD